ncbi:MAG: hypothetical protein ACJAQ2_002431, partial [Vicingaceae bacterium]
MIFNRYKNTLSEEFTTNAAINYQKALSYVF